MPADLPSSFSGRWLTAPEDLAPFLADWRGLYCGRALGVAQPNTVNDVAAIVAWCAANRVPLVPQGGNTSMSGAATPDGSGNAVILSLKRLCKVRSIDPLNNTITVDAGCLLAEIQTAADTVGRLFPLSLGAEGSCNAGGSAVLRYGNMRDLCLGLEVVTSDGEIWNGLRGLRKDNSGYDLRDLYIGSEGTLGVITGAVLKLFPRPVSQGSALVGVPDLLSALRLLEAARTHFHSELTAYEFFSQTCLDLVEDHVPTVRNPFDTRHPWYILVELSFSRAADAGREQFEALLADAYGRGLIADAALASSDQQRQSFWRLRESISQAQGSVGKTIKHDVAVPTSAVPEFVSRANAVVRQHWPDMLFITFGHLGDGNLHYNFSPRPGCDQQKFMAKQDAVNRAVHDIVVDCNGTFSAEHGLGVLRRDEAVRLKPPIELALMRRVKHAMDPLGIMNPGKVLA